jgi:hypothetical protein
LENWFLRNYICVQQFVHSQIFICIVIKKGRGFAPNEALATVQSKSQTTSSKSCLKMVLIRARSTNDGKDDRKNTLNTKVLKPLSAPVGKRLFRSSHFRFS